ncbi:MAG: hypothetical protein ABIV25_07450, partial [Paracoccaceae bacterium]
QWLTPQRTFDASRVPSTNKISDVRRASGASAALVCHSSNYSKRAIHSGLAMQVFWCFRGKSSASL